MTTRTILAGTYTDTGSKGIYAFDLTDGVMSNPRVFAEIDSPKYISVQNGLTASIGKFENGCGIAVFDEAGNELDHIVYEQKTSCYITWKGNEIYTANYHLGTFSRILFEDNHLKLDKTVEIREGAGCHEVLFHEDHIFVPALFLDRILIFDNALAYQGSINFPSGTGPRHGLFTRDGKTLYVLSELSNELFVLDTDGWKLRSVIPVLPDGRTYQRGSAAIRFGNGESLIYTSTRKQDIISVIDPHTRRVRQGAYSGGKHPRDFLIVNGYLLCANRYSDTIVCYSLDGDGAIGPELSRINVPQAVSLAVLNENS
ncbi:MAG: beta-propeller fold lactonase family protein [Solobacterium sp.]|nr:beta-propeller fold lactonase family protein [Solobacterium sp.]